MANFSATPTTGIAPLAVTFSNTTTGSVTSWAWNFGDGTSSTAQHPSHTYSATGTYTGEPYGDGARGGHTATKTNFITVTLIDPVANFSATPTTGTGTPGRHLQQYHHGQCHQLGLEFWRWHQQYRPTPYPHL